MEPTLLKDLALGGGTWVVYALLLSSIHPIAVIIERAILLTREEKAFLALRAEFMAAWSKGGSSLDKIVGRHEGAAARILRAALSHPGASGVVDIFAAASIDEKNRLEKRLLILGTLGNNAPFVGLFGTVLGVIKAFHDLAQASAGPEAVMQGLSEALIATAVGLFVAIPSVVGYNYFQKKVRDILSGTESLGRLALSRLRSSS